MSDQQPGAPQDQDQQDYQRWRQFGQTVERLRLERGYTATQLAKHAGVSFQSVVTIEQGGFRQREGGPWMLPNPQDRIRPTWVNQSSTLVPSAPARPARMRACGLGSIQGPPSRCRKPPCSIVTTLW